MTIWSRVLSSALGSSFLTNMYGVFLSLSLSLSLPSFHDFSPQNAIGAWYVNTTLPEGLWSMVALKYNTSAVRIIVSSPNQNKLFPCSLAFLFLYIRTWNWMEPVLGTASFTLLAFQFSRWVRTFRFCLYRIVVFFFCFVFNNLVLTS